MNIRRKPARTTEKRIWGGFLFSGSFTPGLKPWPPKEEESPPAHRYQNKHFITPLFSHACAHVYLQALCFDTLHKNTRGEGMSPSSTVRSRIGREDKRDPKAARLRRTGPTRAKETQEPVFPVRSRDAHTAKDRPLQRNDGGGHDVSCPYERQPNRHAGGASRRRLGRGEGRLRG